MSSSSIERTALLVLVACAPEPAERPLLPTTTTDGCHEPLNLSVERSAVPVLGGARISAEGGSGEIGFRMGEAPSGGSVSPTTGSYVAGPTAGVTDLVIADDLTCGVSAQIAVEVVPALVVRPQTATVPPGTAFELEATGGSGEVQCTAQALGSGGSVSGCRWAAGQAEGTDVITVEDARTGEVRTVRYGVRQGASFALWGERLLLAQGHPFHVRWTAGTDEVELEGAMGGLDWSDSTLTGLEEGSYQIVATDRFVPSMQTTFRVDVAAPRTIEPIPDGERSYWAQIAGADFNGDGRTDVVVGWAEGSLQAHYGGAVAIYRGRQIGVREEPEWAVGGTQQYAFAGRSVAVGDLNADGVPDLALGADAWDAESGNDAGRVDVHYGVAGALPPEQPGVTLLGERGGDRLGSGMAICDVDGDGYDDLAVAGYGMEDRDRTPILSAEGGIEVWRGGPSGVYGAPTWKLYGRQYLALMGRALVAGDVDGDGRCDLLAGAYTTRLFGSERSTCDGMMWLFTGAAIQAGDLEAQRYYVCEDDDPVVQLGKAMTLGDVDGDGRDDVIAGGWYADTPATSSGAAWVFLEADHDGESVWASSSASATLEGNDAYDYFGLGVAVGDGHLWVAGGQDEAAGGPNELGALRGFDKSQVRGVLSAGDAAVVHVGIRTNSFLGQALAEVGDVDGDGVTDLVAVASRDRSFGPDRGALYLFHGQDDGPTLAELPDLGSGDHLGTRNAVALVDVVGRGSFDLVAGAWGHAGTGYDEGAVFRWVDGSGGWSPTADVEYRGLLLQGTADRVGVSVATAGDFDGDGTEDVLVIGQYDDQPSSFDSLEFANHDACPAAQNSIGVARVIGAEAKETRFWLAGYAAGDRLDMGVGAFDHNGDGFDDILVGSTAYGSEGGFSLAYGRPPDPSGRIEVVCDAQHWLGVSANSVLGASAAAVGDVDQDGCDEVAVGADADDLGRTNQGSVRVLWGFGPGCARSEPEVTTVVSGTAFDRLGYALAGNRDVDGDGAPDLVVSALDADVGHGDVGAVWLLSGKWLASLPSQPASTLPAEGATLVAVAPRSHRFDGDVVNGDFGSAVALMPDPDEPTATWVVVGQRAGSVSGVPGSGGAVVLEWTEAGFAPTPVALIGGESSASLLGWGLAARADAPVLAVGAPLSDAGGLDNGAVYPFRLGDQVRSAK